MLVSVPATSANLGPGFDALGLAVDLRNEIIIKPSNFLSLATTGEGADNLKIRKNTLFLDIFNKQYQKITDKNETFRFEFTNRIPLSRGLGSSSAVIVAALASAFVAAGVTYTKRDLLNLSLEYEKHPDNITPAVMGGFNIACLEDGRVYSRKKRLPEYLRAVLVVPNKTISTARSRTTLPKHYSKEETIYSLSRASYLTALFMSESWDLLRIASKDKLHQTRRMKMMPELFEVQKQALKNGALMSTLSGSGSTFFNLAYDGDAELMAEVLRKRFPEFRVFVTSLDNNGLITKS